MVGEKFSRIAEEQSKELAEMLVRRLTTSPRTTAYQVLNEAELHKELFALLHSLTDWLMYRPPQDVEAFCAELGRKRAKQSVPLDQGVTAMISCRDALLDLLLVHRMRSRISHQADSGSGLFEEMEFLLAVNHFFDDAIYYFMRAYQEEVRESAQVA
ncbi:MAG: hypothetical protein P4M01_08455 [Acidobacteriota bacterium]|nr:hypothetical protein [Acidobacteriota bacterium]